MRTGVDASQSTVDFGELDDRLWTVGADAALDTRGDPAFPRNAFVLGAGWTGLHVRSRLDDRINRYTTDARGYLGLVGQAVAAGARAVHRPPTGTLPDYERLLLGGASTLRGFRTGTFDGDRMLVTSAEAARADHLGAERRAAGRDRLLRRGQGLRRRPAAERRRLAQGVGGGVFLIAPLVKLNLDVAHGLNGRRHAAASELGFSF